MKPIIFIVIFYISSFSFGQNKRGVFFDIKNKYQLIRELVDTNTLRQHHTEYSCNESSDKGSISFYYNGNELKHIIHTYTVGHVKYRDEFYVWDDQLFFQYSIHDIWYKDYEKKSSGKRKLVNVNLTFEERFYFKDGNAIKCQFKDFENRSNYRKKVKTNYVKNITVDCDQAQAALEKFTILSNYQKLNIENACNLPKSITNREPLDMMYSITGQN
ncbi:hypothetical protein [Aquimarina algicola]|uniref:Uncharacterized protein n=1 Tax=Aquimarina algicola TaxID=2589995 RepID=A0A504IVU9_9FLAO|nr:hypothetical protein [Aquimarina algicola]TPN82134.1 hypothetical protein FHK87_22170 [Aquimarina algicola]